MRPPTPAAEVAAPLEEVRQRLRRLYGQAAGEAAFPRFDEALRRWRERLAVTPGTRAASPTQEDVVLIAYPDHLQRPGEVPLATLAGWCREHLRGLVSTVHVLPFHPSTSYEGYAVTDYMAVDPALGSWRELEDLGRDFGLMVDLVLNHCSASHPWFRQFLEDREPGRGYFHAVPDPEEPWLRAVRRARNLPLTHPFETAAGVRHVWTTYSPDLIDLNWGEPGVALEFLEVLLDAVRRGAHMVRLDAFVYTWKQPGTGCVALPETHELLGLIQDLLAAAGAEATRVLPSITNVTQAENYAYFGAPGQGRRADLVYHLPLAALVLQSLYRADGSRLARWLEDLPAAPPGCAYLNLTATHDGIGLTWLRDILPPDEVAAVVEAARRRGALLSSRRATAGSEDLPWEINATWPSACAPGPDAPAASHAARVLATQAIVLALRGVPALYMAVLAASANDTSRAARTGDPRAINRGRVELSTWETAAAEPGSLEAEVLEGLKALLRARRGQAAFHPEGDQRVLALGEPAVLAIERAPPGHPSGGAGGVVCLTSLAPGRVTLAPGRLGAACGRSGPARDLLGGPAIRWEGRVRLEPYQTLWLVDDHGPRA